VSSRTLLKTEFNCSDIGAPVNNLLTVKDPSGNTATCNALVTVKDNLSPTPVCNNTTVTLGSNGNVTVYPSILADSSFDNCSVTGYLPVAKTYNSAGIYNLVITVNDWSGNTATCVSVVTVNQNSPVRDEADGTVTVTNSESDGLLLNVYPNPSSGSLTVDFELPEEQMFRLNIHDITGRLIWEEQRTGLKGKNSMFLDVQKAPSGLYLLECTSAPLRSVKRIMIQH
jgi:hypothetical protein